MEDRLPHRFGDRASIAEACAACEGVDPGGSSGRRLRLAGRVLGRRGQGKLSFVDLDDRSGRIQLMASLDGLGEEAFAAVKSVSLGDVVGVEGELIRTRRGEPSLRVEQWQLLAECASPLPDTFHGITDTEARYRQRYLDLLMNPDSRERFLIRSRLVSAVRSFLDGRGFVEVETPILQPIYGGALARPFTTHHNELDRDLYLRIAVELYLKRLIVGGMERVYEIGKNFRNEGVSFKHNPEFTMVETYEAFADYEDVMAMTESMVAFAAEQALGTTVVQLAGATIDLAPPWPRLPLAEAIERESGVNPLTPGRDPEPLRAQLQADGVDTTHDKTWAQLVDHMFSHYVEPRVVAPVFFVDYPVELSPLARAKRDSPGLTERFEAVVAGMEIANGYSELTDPAEQLARFEEQAAAGRAGDEEAHPIDHDYVRALQYGLPPTGGLGVGIDRVAMLLTGTTSIREVVLFPALRDKPA